MEMLRIKAAAAERKTAAQIVGDDAKEFALDGLRVGVDQTWSIDPDEQRIALFGDATVLRARSASGALAPRTDVPPHARRMVQLFFLLPEGLREARVIPSFDVIWTVHAGSTIVTNRTPFERFVIEGSSSPGPRLVDDAAVSPSSTEPMPGKEPPERWSPHPQP